MNPIKELHNQIVDEMVIALEERAGDFSLDQEVLDDRMIPDQPWFIYMSTFTIMNSDINFGYWNKKRLFRAFRKWKGATLNHRNNLEIERINGYLTKLKDARESHIKSVKDGILV